MLPVSILLAVSADYIQNSVKEHAGLAKSAIVVLGLFVGLEQAGSIPMMYSAEVATRYHEALVRAIPDSCQAFLLGPPTQAEGAPTSRDQFDEAGYLASNPDVAQSWHGSAWDHYRQFGYREGRSFNAAAAEVQRSENFHYQVSAMIASAMSGKPTVNGASGVRPLNYPLSNLYVSDLKQRLAAWLSTSCLVSGQLSPNDLYAPSQRVLRLGFRSNPVLPPLPLPSGITQSMPRNVFGTRYWVDWIGSVADPFNRKTVQLEDSDTFSVRGWAVDQPANGPASGAELVLDLRPYQITYGTPREDVAKSLKQPTYVNSGFAVAFPARLVGHGEHVVSIRFIAADRKAYYETPALTVRLR
jgi:hypothetical protein